MKTRLVVLYSVHDLIVILQNKRELRALSALPPSIQLVLIEEGISERKKDVYYTYET